MFQKQLLAYKNKNLSLSHKTTVTHVDIYNEDIYNEECEISKTVLIKKEDSQMEKGPFEYEPSEVPVKDNQQYSKSQVTQSHESKARSSSKLYECQKCNASFKRLSLLLNHSKQHSDGPPYSCNDCSSSFEYEDDWFEHRETGCLGNNTNKTQKSRNPNVNPFKGERGFGRKQFKCRLCSLTYKKVGARNDHERNVHKKLKLYSCDRCGKKFYKKFSLTVHMQVHCSDRPHQCNICNKKFKSPLHVKIHMKLHKDDRPFECKVCGKAFKTQTILNDHGLMHNKGSNFHCDVCGKGYRYRTSLFLHQRIHKMQRPYKCTVCGATFIVKSHLTEHFRIHTGVRPFQCEFCLRHFPRAYGLRKHLISHIKSGLDFDLEAVLYQAKLKSNVKPRESITDQNKKQPDTQNESNMLVLRSAKILQNPEDNDKFEQIGIPTDENVLVIISSTGDGSTCNHTITKISLMDNILRQIKYMNENEIKFTSVDGGTHTQELIEKMRMMDSDNTCELKENIDEDQDMEIPNDGEQGNNVITYTDMGGIIRDPKYNETRGNLLDPNTPVSNDVVLLGNPNYKTRVKSELDPKMEVSNVVFLENRDSNYEKRVKSELEPISEVGNNVVLLEDIAGDSNYETGINSEDPFTQVNSDMVLMENINHQRIPVKENSICRVNQPSRLLVLQSHNTPKSGNSLTVESKKNRKPLKKCRYCDNSYRYLASLEKHEANHGLKDRFRIEREAKILLYEQLKSDDSFNQNTSKAKGAQNKEENEQVDNGESNTDNNSSTRNFPFKCDKCSMAFSFRSEFRKHLKLHSYRYPFTCTKCNQVFRNESFLVRHVCKYSSIAEEKTREKTDYSDKSCAYNSNGIYLINSPPEECMNQISITVSPDGVDGIKTTSVEGQITEDDIRIDEENVLVKNNFDTEDVIQKLPYTMQVSEVEKCEKDQTILSNP